MANFKDEATTPSKTPEPTAVFPTVVTGPSRPSALAERQAAHLEIRLF